MGNFCCITKQNHDINKLSKQKTKQKQDKSSNKTTNNADHSEPLRNIKSQPKQNRNSEVEEINPTKNLQSGKLPDLPESLKKTKIKKRKKKKFQKRQLLGKVASCSTTSITDTEAKQCWKKIPPDKPCDDHHDTVKNWEQQELRLQSEYRKATENIRCCLRAEHRAKAETEMWRAVLDRLSREHRQKLFRHAHILRTKLRRAENLLSFYEVRARNVQNTNCKLKSLIDKMKTDTKAIRDESERRRLNTKNNLDNKVGNLLKELERLKIKFNNVSPSHQPPGQRFSIATTANIMRHNRVNGKKNHKVKPAPFVTAYSRYCNVRALNPKHDRETYTSDVPRYPKLRTRLIELHEPTKPENLSQKAIHISTRLSSDVSCLSISPYPRISCDVSHKSDVTSESELINLHSDVGKTSSPSSECSRSSFSFRKTRDDASSVSPNYVTLVNNKRDVTSLYDAREEKAFNRLPKNSHAIRSSDYHGDKTSRSLPCATKEKNIRTLRSQPASHMKHRR